MASHAIDTFTQAFQSLRGHVHRAASWTEAASVIRAISAEHKADCIALAQTPAQLRDALQSAAQPNGCRLLTDPYAHTDLPAAIDQAQVGVTGMAFAIAQTGTLVEVTQNDATRLVSSLPRVHIGVVSAGQFVATLNDAAPRMRAILHDNPTNCVISFLSGPSRTGDIELRLTLGVHGPEHAHALILDEALTSDTQRHA